MDKPTFESFINWQQSESTDNHQESPVTQSQKWKEGKSVSLALIIVNNNRVELSLPGF